MGMMKKIAQAAEEGEPWAVKLKQEITMMYAEILDNDSTAVELAMERFNIATTVDSAHSHEMINQRPPTHYEESMSTCKETTR